MLLQWQMKHGCTTAVRSQLWEGEDDFLPPHAPILDDPVRASSAVGRVVTHHNHLVSQSAVVCVAHVRTVHSSTVELNGRNNTICYLLAVT